MKRIRLLGLSASLLLLAGAAGAQTTVFYPGNVRYQIWTSDNPNGAQNPSRQQVEAGLAGIPTTDDFGISPTTYSAYDTKEESGDNYADRLTGFFIPAVTTNYTFFVASDDDGDCYLSTDANPLNKRIICQEPTWGNRDEWVSDGGGGAAGAKQKRSDTWSPDGNTQPFKNGIPLVAGQKYWLEAVHHEGGGGDSLGVQFKIVGEPDPTNGAPSRLTGSLIGYGYTIPATLSVKSQATNVTTRAGLEATFTYVVNDTLPDPLDYQWYRNGTVISNATFQQYTLLAQATDNGAQFTCVVTLPYWYSNNIASTSSVATLTVNNTSLSYTNGLKVEQFLGHNRQDVENGNMGPADNISVSLNGAETVVNDNINNYARRMSGWFIPPTTGSYVLFVNSDDDSDLFLSTDATAAHKQLIAQQTSWSNSREWTNTDATLKIASQKRSDQWTNDAGLAPYTNGIALTAGTPYYIEADYHQGGGGDNLGIFAKLVTDPDPTNGTPPIPANELSLLTSPVTTLTWTNQPHALTVFEGGQPIFTGGAKSDSEFAVQYQWQREGTNIAGATGSSYSFTTTVADNGTHFDLIASTAEGGLSITSSVVVLTVQKAVFEQGLALMNYWVNQADQVPGENGLLGTPDFVMAVPSFEAGVNNENGDQYVNELSGFFVPATTGTYDFITTGDDHIDLFLSTDSNPNNKRMICQEPGWSAQLTWGTDNGGGNDLLQKHSETWSNAANVAPFTAGFNLTAGTKYYIEMWHHEGTGGDSMAAYAKLRSGGVVGADPANGTDSDISGNQLGFNAPNTATYVAFTNQPVSVSVLSGTTATLSAGGVSDGTIVIGTTGQFQTGTSPGDKKFRSFPNVLFQWYKNGTLIPGATSSAYTTPSLKPGDTAQYYAAIRALGIATWSNSVTATVTVITDTNKPTVYAAEFDNNLIPTVSVSFSKVMDLASITDITHYSIAGATIAAVLVNSNDARHVQLQLTSPPASLPLSVTLTGIVDFSGNPPAATTVNVPAAELTNSDIGDALANDPAFPGFMWADGAAAYTVKCEGSDIWGAADGFNFSYETKTNDFDVVVRQLTFTKTSQWAKGGLMVREDLTAASRNWNIVNDPSNADGTPALDGNGTGQNQVECNARFQTGQASSGWDNITRPAPAYPNAWVRLKRIGQTLTAFSSSNGVQWVQQAYTDWSTNAPAMSNVVYVGICASAHLNDNPAAVVPLDYYTASFANYNSSFVAPTNTVQATVTAAIVGGNVVVSWTPTGGTLQSSPVVGTGATWTAVGTANPATIPISGASSKFYRVGP